jgi:hypothetical protein
MISGMMMICWVERRTTAKASCRVSVVQLSVLPARAPQTGCHTVFASRVLPRRRGILILPTGSCVESK